MPRVVVADLKLVKNYAKGAYELLIRDLDLVEEELGEVHLGPAKEEIELQAAISVKKKDIRTLPQLAYLYGHLGPITLAILQEQGWETIQTKDQAIDFMKMQLGFYRIIENDKTNEVFKVPLSLSYEARTDRDRVIRFIMALYIWCCDHAQPGKMPKKEKEWIKYRKIKKRKIYEQGKRKKKTK
jgi:hypothetical protein